MPNQPDGAGQGGFSADHAAEAALPILVSPTTNGKGKNTIRMEIIPVGCWRLDDVRFEFGASFVLPETRAEFEDLDALIKRHPEAPLSVFGHADPVGKDAFNKQLSGRRAEAVYAILIRDAARWEKLYQAGGSEEGWGVRSIQHMLKALGHDAGPVDGDQGDLTTAAIQSFQGATPGLTVDGNAGPLTREKLFLAYMHFLFPAKVDKTAFLNKGNDKGGKGDFQGCGELNPAMVFSQQEFDDFSQPANRGARDEENAINRRVLILLFRPGTPPTNKWPCPRATESDAGCTARKWSDGDLRRSPQAVRRKFKDTLDTFGCRFYHRLTYSSPCEGIVPKIPLSWIEFSLVEYPFHTNSESPLPLEGASQNQQAKDWWPERQAAAPRGSEKFDARLTNGQKSGQLDDKGFKRFDSIPEGQCQIRFPDFYKKADEHFGPPSEWPKPAILPPPKPSNKVPPKLSLRRVSPQFAPGVEKLIIVYDIARNSHEAVELTIVSAKDPATTLIHRVLLAAAKIDGDGKRIELDGQATGGPLSGKFLDPAHSPYQIKLALAGGGLATTKETKVVVDKIEVKVDAPEDKIFMNDPERRVATTAKVLLKNKSGEGVPTPVEMDVTFTFTPNAANITASASHQYSAAPSKRLGKKGDATAIYWDVHPDSAATSTDGFRTNAKAEVITTKGADRGVAKVHFIPSGVGGNKYKVKATVAGVSGESADLTVWRRISVTGYEMHDQNHISRHAKDKKIQKFYEDGTFVEYHLGTVTKLKKEFTVRYIGLWDRASGSQLDWKSESKKQPDETPTAPEIAAVAGTNPYARGQAHLDIEEKAELWAGRLSRTYDKGIAEWAEDAGLPPYSIVAIKFDHPKYSAGADHEDSITQEWLQLSWLTITVDKKPVHPDNRWVEGQGFTTPRSKSVPRIYITDDMSGAATRRVIAHEAAHHSRDQFHREKFGDGDHSAAAGLMDESGTLNSFTAREKAILRGEL